MAKVVIRGFFGAKQSFNVASAAVGGSPYNSNQVPTATWAAGNLFVLSAAAGLTDAYVEKNSVSGSAIMGVAMENSSEALTAVAGMSQPSGSKVTLLHGHSEFEIEGDQYEVYEPEVESASLMDVLYASPNGKFASFAADGSGQAIGFITKVPSSANSYTLGVVLFG